MTTKGCEQWLETFPEFMTQTEDKEDSNVLMSLKRLSQRQGWNKGEKQWLPRAALRHLEFLERTSLLLTLRPTNSAVVMWNTRHSVALREAWTQKVRLKNGQVWNETDLNIRSNKTKTKKSHSFEQNSLGRFQFTFNDHSEDVQVLNTTVLSMRAFSRDWSWDRKVKNS